MKIFRQEVRLYGTVYARAENLIEAQKQIASFVAEGLSYVTGPEVSGRGFDDPELPDVSLSPAISLAHTEGGIEEIG